MSNHTIFYQAVKPQPSYDEVKAFVYKSLVADNMELYRSMIDGTLDKSLKEAYPEWTPELGERSLPIIQRIGRLIEGNYCKQAVCNRYEHRNELTIFVNGQFYFNNRCMPDDCFRIRYMGVSLFSLEETLKFLNENAGLILMTTDTIEKLEHFWSDHPDGLIKC